MPALSEIHVAQLESRVGGFEANIAAICGAVVEAAALGKQIVATPELSLCGYPPEDLILRADFAAETKQALETLLAELDRLDLPGARVFVGTVTYHQQGAGNTYLEILLGEKAEVVRQYIKRDLPNYGVFDEARVFKSGQEIGADFIRSGADRRISVAVCEDIWGSAPLEILPDSELVLVPNASPFERGKSELRLQKIRELAKASGKDVLYFNCTGAQDELVFDSFCAAWVEGDLTQIQTFCGEYAATVPAENPGAKEEIELAEVYSAIVAGLRGYFIKNGFKTCALGLSGGIDSALVAAIAADAAGSENVSGISMPSQYSSEHSRLDAFELAQNLGVNYSIQPIEQLFNVYCKCLPENGMELSGLAEENLQARIRGNILMAASNSAKQPCLVLATGNKSELAVGYSTIYGDAVGGFAPIKDALKTEVWKLAKWRNSVSVEQLAALGFSSQATRPIPLSSIEKPPSAELRPGQTDQDSLPDYSILDAQIELIMSGQTGDQKIMKLIKNAEWKRRQYPLGPKISHRAFGKDWRYPLTSGG